MGYGNEPRYVRRRGYWYNDVTKDQREAIKQSSRQRNSEQIQRLMTATITATMGGTVSPDCPSARQCHQQIVAENSVPIGTAIGLMQDMGDSPIPEPPDEWTDGRGNVHKTLKRYES